MLADRAVVCSTALEPDGVTPAGLVMEHRLVVPFGSDPVVVSQTVLTNNSPKPLSLSYYEVWGASTYQMAFNKGGHTSADLDARRLFQRNNYTASVQPMGDLYGVSCEQTYTGESGADTPPFSAPGATLWDEQPPVSFLVNAYEHDVTTDTGCSASAFFGSSEGGDAAASKPAFGLRCDNNGTGSGSATSDAALILRRNVSLAVGDTIEFAFLYGYVVPPSTSRYDAGGEGRATPTMKSLIAKYSYGRTRGNEILVQNGKLLCQVKCIVTALPPKVDFVLCEFTRRPHAGCFWQVSYGEVTSRPWRLKIIPGLAARLHGASTYRACLGRQDF
jgi:hypothetical protein